MALPNPDGTYLLSDLLPDQTSFRIPLSEPHVIKQRWALSEDPHSSALGSSSGSKLPPQGIGNSDTGLLGL